AAAQALPRLGRRALEAARGARIEHLLGAAAEIGEELVLAANHLRPEGGTEGLASRWYACRTRQGATLALPFRQAAIQHRDTVVAEDAEHPPRASGARQAIGVVGDDVVVVADPEGLD